MGTWLVTWESHRKEKQLPKKIAAVLPGTEGPETVRKIVQALYAAEMYSQSELVSLRGKRNPYPAEFTKVNGITWHGRMYCGHEPQLYARLVDRLKVPKTKGALPTWVELPFPSFSKPGAE